MQSDTYTPPPTPPRVAFDPPLFLQRRTAVFDLLHKVHKLPRFNGQLRSLLDVGCGVDCLLLSSLVPPNDELPLEQVTGIDLDDGLLDRTLVESLGPNGMNQGDEGRWRRFGLTMLHGTFERLALQNLAHHDIIVSAEVIEHLDPGPISNFAPVLLGRLRPKVCIITTPNRDFNDLFSLPFTPEMSNSPNPPNTNVEGPVIALGEVVDPINLPPPQIPTAPPIIANEEAWRGLAPGDVCSSGDRYWRAGVPYGMRHPDHRFEWTRQEFRNWAIKAAEDFGYDVAFTGVGGLGNGMCVVGSSGWAVGDALARGCGYDGDGDEPPDQRDEGVLSKANEVWGDCSQIAVFTIREDEEEDAQEYINTMDWTRQHGTTAPDSATTVSPMNPFFFPNPITEVAHHDFPFDTDEVFPPSYLTVMELLERELSNYLPNRIREQWSKSSLEILQSKLRSRRHSAEDMGFLYESDSECDYSWNPEVDGDEIARQARKKERRYEKKIRREMENAVLTGKSAELIKVVKVTGLTIRTLWEGSVGGKKGLRRLCRFREEVFKDVLMNGWKTQLGKNDLGDKAEGGNFFKSIIDTTGLYKEARDQAGQQEGPELMRRRQMSISRTASAVTPLEATVRPGQQLTSPTTLPIKRRPEALSLADPNIEPAQVLSSHVFTAFECPSSCSSFSDLKVSDENTPILDITRPRSASMPHSPFIPDSVPSSPRVPLNRSQSANTVPTSPQEPQGPQTLPLQLESDTKMVVKLFSVSTTRSVIDLIRRDLTEEDRDILKRWRVIKVEFNAQEPEPAPPEVVRSTSVPRSRTERFVYWQDDVRDQEDWATTAPDAPSEEPQTIETWDTWGTDTSTGDTTSAEYPAAPEDDNVSVISNQSLPYSIDEYGTGPSAEPSPWGPADTSHTTSPPIKFHTEFIYPLSNVATLLSTDKGKHRETAPLQADLTGFLSAYKALEANDTGFLNVDWAEYTLGKARVARWMEERRREVSEYRQAAEGMLAAGFAREEIPGRRAGVGWEEWLARQERGGGERGEEAETGQGGVGVGIVVFRPPGRGGMEGLLRVLEGEGGRDERGGEEGGDRRGESEGEGEGTGSSFSLRGGPGGGAERGVFAGWSGFMD